MAEKSTLDNLIHRLKEWRWPEALCGLLPDVMLVMDEDIAAAIKSAYGPFKCHFSTPHAYTKDLAKLGGITKLVFFCRKQEMAHVKEARQAQKNIAVYSGTYDLAPLSVGGAGYFQWEKPEAAPVVANETPEALLVLAAPASDADFLCQTLQRNRMGDPKEFINRTVVAWAQEQGDFQLLRFLQGVVMQQGKKGLDFLLYTDVLLDLVDVTPFTLSRFVRLLERTNTQMVYFTRRDKCTQSALLPLLTHRLARSIWTMPADAMANLAGQAPTPEDMHTATYQLLKQEVQVETALEGYGSYKSVTLEEVAESPSEVLDVLAVYLDRNAPAQVDWVDFSEGYKGLPKILSASNSHKEALKGQLGLYMNEHGSYEFRGALS
ncbi:MAG: hypothetical protein KUG56_04590 [Kordiimonadaceae bacterium]|nr:hypothetical protein [Kordiimonadaceae bacterium]